MPKAVRHAQGHLGWGLGGREVHGRPDRQRACLRVGLPSSLLLRRPVLGLPLCRFRMPRGGVCLGWLFVQWFEECAESPPFFFPLGGWGGAGGSASRGRSGFAGAGASWFSVGSCLLEF